MTQTEENREPSMANGQDGNNEGVEASQPSSPETTEEMLWKTVKVNDRLRFRSDKSDPWIMGTVVGRAGKASGGLASWFNVETSDDRF